MAVRIETTTQSYQNYEQRATELEKINAELRSEVEQNKRNISSLEHKVGGLADENLKLNNEIQKLLGVVAAFHKETQETNKRVKEVLRLTEHTVEILRKENSQLKEENQKLTHALAAQEQNFDKKVHEALEMAGNANKQSTRALENTQSCIKTYLPCLNWW